MNDDIREVYLWRLANHIRDLMDVVPSDYWSTPSDSARWWTYQRRWLRTMDALNALYDRLQIPRSTASSRPDAIRTSSRRGQKAVL
ncbi:MAG: hypothetical protein CMK74_01100 [Pseudomonadales bacterium]|jgi:hypothetical protein|nr:hypothetical protein [Pseudomonadales bacterium]